MVWEGSNQGGSPQYFYNSLIRKYVVVFGRQFSEILVQRQQANSVQQNFRVPLEYGPKDKNIVRLTSDPNLDRPYSALLPNMSYEIANIAYDADRKLAPIAKQTYRNPNNFNTFYVQYAPVPYNIDFNLYIYVKNFDDGAQILEQIFPFFQPDWTPKIELISTPFVDTRDVPIELHPNLGYEDKWDDDFKVRRLIIFTLSFTMRAYFYGPVKEKPVIKFIEHNLRLGSEMGLTLGQTLLSAEVNSTANTISVINVNSFGIPNTGTFYAQLENEYVYVTGYNTNLNTFTVQRGQLNTYANAHANSTLVLVKKDPGISETIQVQPGLTANGQPSYSVNTSVNASLIDVNSDFGFISQIIPGNNDTD